MATVNSLKSTHGEPTLWIVDGGEWHQINGQLAPTIVVLRHDIRSKSFFPLIVIALIVLYCLEPHSVIPNVPPAIRPYEPTTTTYSKFNSKHRTRLNWDIRENWLKSRVSQFTSTRYSVIWATDRTGHARARRNSVDKDELAAVVE